jgi:hypothetical protein
MQQYIDNLLAIKNSTDVNYAIMMCNISTWSAQQFLANEINQETAKIRFTSQLQAAELNRIPDEALKIAITEQIQNLLNFVSE